jgi:hypothetical protein
MVQQPDNFARSFVLIACLLLALARLARQHTRPARPAAPQAAAFPRMRRRCAAARMQCSWRPRLRTRVRAPCAFVSHRSADPTRSSSIEKPAIATAHLPAPSRSPFCRYPSPPQQPLTPLTPCADNLAFCSIVNFITVSPKET